MVIMKASAWLECVCWCCCHRPACAALCWIAWWHKPVGAHITAQTFAPGSTGFSMWWCAGGTAL